MEPKEWENIRKVTPKCSHERKETAKIMKILVTGVKGQLGHDVVNELTGRGHQAIGVDIEEMDITDPGSVEQAVSQAKPDGVIHCAAWTAVDDAEDEKNREKVRLVNGTGTKHVADACKITVLLMLFPMCFLPLLDNACAALKAGGACRNHAGWARYKFPAAPMGTAS